MTLRIRDYWTHTRIGPPLFCSGCGNALWTEIVEDETSPKFDRMTGNPLPPKQVRIAYCKEGKDRHEREMYQIITDGSADKVFHDNWVIPEPPGAMIRRGDHGQG